MSDQSLILFYSSEGGSMTDFQFRVVDPVRRRRVASDPRENYRFLRQVLESSISNQSTDSKSALAALENSPAPGDSQQPSQCQEVPKSA